MSIALSMQASRVGDPGCPVRRRQGVGWSQDLPPALRELVVAPVSFDVFREYEMAADRTRGHDAANEPCYCAFRHVLTQWRSDDDEVFYEAPVHAETLTAWRLLDARWLICRSTVDDFDLGAGQTDFSLSDAMPR